MINSIIVLMAINPVVGINGSTLGYKSGPVYTVFHGAKLFVSSGYIAKTSQEVERLANLNARVKHFRVALAYKMDANNVL
jgi:hypothetical protein